MTKVLLVNPKSIDVLPSYLPYGLLYIAAFLRSKRIRVKIYDTNTIGGDFVKFVEKEKPKIIGISILSGPCLADAVQKAKLVQKNFPKVKIVFGGIHTTIFPKDVLKQDYVDYIIMNEGEHPMFELSEYLLKRKGSLKRIKNLGYKKGKKLVLNSIRPFIDLNTLPLPAWDLVPMEKYIHNKFYCNKVVTLHTSRGCPWDCAYCYNRLVNFRRWRGISAERILDQIEYLMKNYGIKGFQFYDDEFDVNAQRVKEFCHLLLDRKIKIKWAHYSRTNVANKKRFALEKKAGCEFIEFGVESGSPRILKMINKQQTIKDIRKAFKICRKVGLKAGAMFMIGLPTETKKDIEKTINLVNSLGAQQTINTIYHPYPGSELYNYCLAKGLFRLPEKIEEQGPYFDIGNAEINVSQVPINYLKKVNSVFFLKNICNEAVLCLKTGNFSLLFYYLKKILHPNRLKSLVEKFFLLAGGIGSKSSPKAILNEKKFYESLTTFNEILAKYKLSSRDFLKHSRSYNIGSIEFIQKIESRLPRGSKLLEIGVGMGFLSVVLLAEGYKVHGLEVKRPKDHDPAECSPVREKFREKVWVEIKKRWGGEIKFYDGSSVPFKDAFFDGVIFDGVLEHVHPNERGKLMQEINRVLKKNGFVFVSRCPNKLSYAELAARLLYGHGHWRLFSKSQLESIFSKSSFIIDEMRTTDFIFNFAPGPGTEILNFLFRVLRPLEKVLLKSPVSVFAHNVEIIARKK